MIARRRRRRVPAQHYDALRLKALEKIIIDLNEWGLWSEMMPALLRWQMMQSRHVVEAAAAREKGPAP
jgi:hypothetical protein